MNVILEPMTQRRLLCTALACASLFTLSSAAQESGYWRASSSSAKSTTGDIQFTPRKISIDFSNFTLAQIRALTPAEASALFSADPSANGSGNLFRVDISSSKKFLHHHTLCGDSDTDWVVTYVQGHTLQVALFTGAAIPALTPDALNNGTTTVCNTFTYVR